MGLSRNKVAVSEGAAGSPPFYGEHDKRAKADLSRLKNRENKITTKGFEKQLLFNFLGLLRRFRQTSAKRCGLIAQVVRARA